MRSQTKSLTSIALHRFFRNPWGVSSLLWILLMVFLAFFAYVFAPDHTTNANQMNIAIHSKPPGFEVLILKVPLNEVEQSVWDKTFFGSQALVNEIPITSFSIQNQKLFYQTYHESSTAIEEKSLEKEDFKSQDSWNDITSRQINKRTFYLGTDKYGRDLLSRMLVGARISLSVGFVAVFISLLVGVFMGALGGFFGGKVDALIMWIVNIIWSVPTLLLVIAITLALGKGFWQVFIAVGLTMWVEVARVVRGQIMGIKEMQYITAAKALGFSNFRIIFKHILPNTMAPIIVISAANFASAVLVESGLSFLGLGAQPPIPSWGGIIKDHYHYVVLGKPYLALVPGLAIMLLTLAFMMVGNALRDAFDVKQH